MGRYGHHNNHTRYQRQDNRRSNVKEDWDSSKPEKSEKVEQDWSNEDRDQPSIVEKLKQKYEKYTSPEAKMERRQKELEKRKRKIEDLSYNAKKEGLKATIRKSKQTAPMTMWGTPMPKKGNQRSSSAEGVVHLPKNNFGSMDRMFGIGGATAPKRTTKPKGSGWGNMDRMLGL